MPLDTEKILLEQTAALARIETKVDMVASLQSLTNGKVGKLEVKIEMLENARSKQDGQISSLKWTGTIIIIVIGIAEFIISHYWK